MPDQPTRKLDKKSRKLLEELVACNAEFGGPDYAPKGFELRPRPSLVKKPPQVSDADFLRLKAWLRELDGADYQTCFSALLQVWLDAHGICWPRGVFLEDLAVPGRGVLAGPLGREANQLREEGNTWGDIARKLLPKEVATAMDRYRATDKVRLAAASYRKGVQREIPTEGTVAQFAWKMLDIEPDR